MRFLASSTSRGFREYVPVRMSEDVALEGGGVAGERLLNRAEAAADQRLLGITLHIDRPDQGRFSRTKDGDIKTKELTPSPFSGEVRFESAPCSSPIRKLSGLKCVPMNRVVATLTVGPMV